MGETRVGDWQCPNPACINNVEFPSKFVFGCKVNCPKCGTGKSASKPGDWCCPNPQCVNHQNTVYGCKMQCTRCGAARPPLNAKGGAMPNESPMMVGGAAGGPNPGAFGGGKGAVPMPRVGDWHCPNPACKNHSGNFVYGSKANCPVCGTEKPEQPAEPAPQQPAQPKVPEHPWAQYLQGPGPLMPGGCAGMPVMGQQPRGGGRPGDWHCPNETCKNHRDNVVFGSKSTCPICGMSKPDDAAEASGPIFPSAYTPPPMMMQAQPQMMFGAVNGGKGGGKAGDWHCPNPVCKNHTHNLVYASKSHCSICGTPKPGDRERSRSPRPM
mmetsp:Transcript_15158/g.41672  ORF Transcript_15158/g.41672 Transcript_15158/m.41672 type:complete len:325 (-) Transcript_15158:130-1104(-)